MVDGWGKEYEKDEENEGERLQYGVDERDNRWELVNLLLCCL